MIVEMLDFIQKFCGTGFSHFLLLTLCLKEMPLNTFANREDPDQAALVRAA